MKKTAKKATAPKLAKKDAKKGVKKTSPKKVAKTEARKPAKKAVKKPAQKKGKGVSAKTKVMLSDVCTKFAKANGIGRTSATVMIGGCLAYFAISRAIDNEIKAGRKVGARRADKKELDAAAEMCFNTDGFKALKVKPTDIPGMAELMEAYGREIDTIDFSGM